MQAREVAAALRGRLLGDDTAIDRISSLHNASACDLSIIMWPKDIRLAKICRAGVLLTTVDVAADYADSIAASLIVVDDLATSIFTLHSLFSNSTSARAQIACSARIHKTAVIHDGAVIGNACSIAAGVVVYGNARIGDHVSIGANCVIGSEGFVPYGLRDIKVLPCFGFVNVDDHVRIGALSTIDRGFLGATHIGSNTVLDNMVHIGHDAYLGNNVVVAGQAGIAGFVRIGDHVTIGGQAGIAPHVSVGEGARISGKSMVHCDIKKYEIWSGNPSVPHAMYLRSYGKLKREFKDKHR